MDLSYRKYLIKRWVGINLFRYKEADKYYPEIDQKCRLWGIKGVFTYINPGFFPDFADLEKERREWYQFIGPDGEILNANGVLWKSLTCK